MPGISKSSIGHVLPFDVDGKKSEQSQSKVSKVIIIGAGPAGLSAASHLKKSGIDYEVLEKGPVPGNSFASMPDHLRILTSFKNSRIDSGDTSLVVNLASNAAVSAHDYQKYLASFALNHGLNIVPNCEVSEVSKEDSVFKVETTQGTYYGEVVINATGYYFNPVTPSFPNQETTDAKILHFNDFKNPADLLAKVGSQKSKCQVLVVGKGLSAGQLLDELAKDESFELSISHRGTVRPISRTYSFGWNLAQTFISYVEPILSWFSPYYSSGEKPQMMAGPGYDGMQNGLIHTFPDIDHFVPNDRTVVFVDGRQVKADAVIFATGYKPNIPHLKNFELANLEVTGDASPLSQGEHEKVPGLYFLGIDREFSSNSRFLRGIKKDAKAVSENVKQSLES